MSECELQIPKNNVIKFHEKNQRSEAHSHHLHSTESVVQRMVSVGVKVSSTYTLIAHISTSMRKRIAKNMYRSFPYLDVIYSGIASLNKSRPHTKHVIRVSYKEQKEKRHGDDFDRQQQNHVMRWVRETNEENIQTTDNMR